MISAAIPISWKREVLEGIHQAVDTYKIALFTSSAKLDKLTESYSPQGEVSGQGYKAGGIELAGFAVGVQGDAAYIDWNADPSWKNATISARGALIYNATRGNRAVAILDFGSEVSSVNGPFTVELPSPGSGAVLRAI